MKLRVSDSIYERFRRHALWLANKNDLQAECGSFRKTDFTRLQFPPGALFRGAVFARASFAKRDLNRIDFQGANLHWADFAFCDLTGVNFTNCDMREARLFGAKIGGANFKGALLSGADLAETEGWDTAVFRMSDLAGSTGLDLEKLAAQRGIKHGTWELIDGKLWRRSDGVCAARDESAVRPWFVHKPGGFIISIPMTGARAKFRSAESAVRAADARWPYGAEKPDALGLEEPDDGGAPWPGFGEGAAVSE